MSMIDRIFSLITPFECINCSKEGMLLCVSCRNLLLPVPLRCYRCLKVSDGSVTCKSCRVQSRLYAVYVPVAYEGLSKELIWRLKYASAKSAAKEIAQIIAPTLPVSDFLIVPVPTTTKRARQRGYDQANLIAKELSMIIGRPYLQCLARHGAAHQVGASRWIRKKQLKDVFRVKSLAAVKNSNVLLVDDVLTTGSTLEAAAVAIRRSGAKRVSGAVFAQTK